MSLVIAIDGPSGSGKGTLSKALVEKYGFSYLDTGLLFRAVAWKAHLHDIPLDDELALCDLIEKLSPTDMGDLKSLRSEENGGRASKIAVLPAIRKALTQMMRSFAEGEKKTGKGAILDGRDIGSVVCPHADLKFFITASPEARAERRFKELQTRGVPVIFEDVLRQMIQRDQRDQTRNDAPMVQASDAIYFDTSDLSSKDVVDQASKAVDKALS